VSSLPLVGASGAVSGIIASYVRLFPKARLCQIIMFFPLNIPIKAYIFIWFLWNALMGFLYGTYSNVSWSAHLGGFVAGYIFLGRFLPYKIEKLTEET
jgi:membrane associated rhomboid family serine protease